MLRWCRNGQIKPMHDLLVRNCVVYVWCLRIFVRGEYSEGQWLISHVLSTFYRASLFVVVFSNGVGFAFCMDPWHQLVVLFTVLWRVRLPLMSVRSLLENPNWLAKHFPLELISVVNFGTFGRIEYTGWKLLMRFVSWILVYAMELRMDSVRRRGLVITFPARRSRYLWGGIRLVVSWGHFCGIMQRVFVTVWTIPTKRFALLGDQIVLDLRPINAR